MWHRTLQHGRALLHVFLCHPTGGNTLLGDVLDVDHGDAMSVGLLDSTLDILKGDISVPEWKLASGEIVVLKINNE